jgi:hypothetical protein
VENGNRVKRSALNGVAMIQRLRYSRWLPFLPAAALALAIVVIGFGFLPRKPHSSLARTNLRIILTAMQNYYAEHGTFPYSPKGPDYALYELRDSMEATYFDGTEQKAPENRAIWDDKEKCLRNGDFLYLNEPGLKPEFVRMIVMSKPHVVPDGVYLGAGWGRVYFHAVNNPDARLLGSCDTPERLLVADARLFEDWSRTHPEAISQRTTHQCDGTGTCTHLSSEGGGFAIQYRYANGRLAGCSVKTAKGVIEETVEFDDLGRIAGVTRRPHNWQDLLP